MNIGDVLRQLGYHLLADHAMIEMHDTYTKFAIYEATRKNRTDILKEIIKHE